MMREVEEWPEKYLREMPGWGPKKKSSSMSAFASESEPCTALAVWSVPNWARILLGADTLASLLLVGPARAALSGQPLPTTELVSARHGGGLSPSCMK